MLGNASFTLAYTTGGSVFQKTSSVGQLAYKMASIPLKRKLSEMTNKEFLEHWKNNSKEKK